MRGNRKQPNDRQRYLHQHRNRADRLRGRGFCWRCGRITNVRGRIEDMKPIFDRESMIAYIDLQIKKSKQVVIDTEDSPVKGDIRLHWYHIGAVETLTDIRQRLMADYRRAPESK